jgi:23S rRNA (guanosine2251-2'-O)-methyltransferase
MGCPKNLESKRFMTKLNAKQLRVSEPTKEELRNIKRNPIYFVLDRIIDTYNIGSLFRLADAIAISKVYLCGDMEYPPNSRIHKAAVGTENWVPWVKTESTLKTVKKLKTKGVQIIAIEQSDSSTDYRELTKDKIHFPTAIICGNESFGIPKEILKEADITVELPMLGINKSFNVWGSTAVVAYKVLETLRT